MTINFEQMNQLYDLIKQGVMQKAEGEGFKIYNMNNGIIRIDIKE